MSERPVRLMLDTNVLVDAYCLWHEHGEAAKELLKVCRAKGAELYYPVHTLKDVLYVLRHEFRRETQRSGGMLSESAALAAQEAALACIRNIQEYATAVGADGSDLWLADKYLRIHHDFEDNLALAACKRIKADYLVTNDRALIRDADVLAKTPAQLVELIELGSIGGTDSEQH